MCAEAPPGDAVRVLLGIQRRGPAKTDMEQLYSAALRNGFDWTAVHAELYESNPRLYSSPDACRMLFSATQAPPAPDGLPGDLDLDALLGDDGGGGGGAPPVADPFSFDADAALREAGVGHLARPGAMWDRVLQALGGSTTNTCM